jgi:hypothetical protein
MMQRIVKLQNDSDRVRQFSQLFDVALGSFGLQVSFVAIEDHAWPKMLAGNSFKNHNVLQ